METSKQWAFRGLFGLIAALAMFTYACGGGGGGSSAEPRALRPSATTPLASKERHRKPCNHAVLVAAVPARVAGLWPAYLNPFISNLLHRFMRFPYYGQVTDLPIRITQNPSNRHTLITRFAAFC